MADTGIRCSTYLVLHHNHRANTSSTSPTRTLLQRTNDDDDNKRSDLPNYRYTMTAAPRLRSIYRSLLRELPPRPVLARERSSIHNRLRTSFTQTNSNAEAAAAEAEQLAAYLRAQRTYVALLERYNPGMDMDEEERVRLTARRVGMDLPKEFQDRLD
ncbi:hypothetical protein LX36DRAFT_665251 [Colletotrichum falcatum]|nr:hypothetical protein LX36DRAFT_665251 [Colletotrichum falcatum]